MATEFRATSVPFLLVNTNDLSGDEVWDFTKKMLDEGVLMFISPGLKHSGATQFFIHRLAGLSSFAESGKRADTMFIKFIYEEEELDR